ncbi:SS-A/Ro ribonucleoprotein [Aliiroseovarius halocynthiae]|uniref:TROVE domain-containing protein n=1 Tax=Aliiroseovarius halocynthiae TaxID=985055 RepID=A0A545SUU3_9RHOB|nr:TROVE domain-containing protein [Aliiroseovarius halocynthiae]TQV68729.1 TROVE domain-containing protein [Aliiroseovarius halocynthiae]SMR71151.1 SS-A/Ro ribonucleoprotein [Aliiroseovarius halocynthiae]
MANKSVFASMKGRLLPKATAKNAAGAPAYAYSDAHALAQVAVTGTFGGMFYQSAQDELEYVVDVAESVDPRFLAQATIYARQNGYMKDMPAVLLAVLARRDPVLFRAVFGRVVDNGKMLRNFVQVVRSGQTGRKSLGSAPKAMVQNWLNTATDRALLQANIGNDPSLADVIKMVHPKPASSEREALFAWIVGRPCDTARLPQVLRDWMVFKETGKGPVPDVPFQMLTQLELSSHHWARLAQKGSWQMVRQNLNTFHRHGVFGVRKNVDHVAALLRDAKVISKARVFPYQLMVTAQNVTPDMPHQIVDALHDAMEIAVGNVPKIHGQVVVCPDVSGSMTMPVTGYRPGATSAVRHVDVAALVAAAFTRVNRGCQVLPFDFDVRDVRLRPRDTVLTNAERLAAMAGGGTNCSAPLVWLNKRGRAPDLVVFVSDNQSWVDARAGGRNTAMMSEWEKIKHRNPKAKLVCIDIAPYGTTQAQTREDVLNVGGFSDAVFDQIAAFAYGQTGPDHWVGEIGKIEL